MTISEFTNKYKKTSLRVKIDHLKDHVDVYGMAFVTATSRGLDLGIVFAYESSPYHPALSVQVTLHLCKKSDLACLLDTSSTKQQATLHLCTKSDLTGLLDTSYTKQHMDTQMEGLSVT